MATGRIRFFNPIRGYGFIIPETGGDDVFLHVTDLATSGPLTFWPGMRVEYALAPKGAGGMKAVNVKFAGKTDKLADELLQRANQLATGSRDDAIDADLMRRAAAILTTKHQTLEAVS